MYGIFDQSAQLVDSMMGDDRVQATLGSRIGGLFGRKVRLKPANDSAAAKEVCDAWEQTAEELLTGWALTESAAYSIFMRLWLHGQIPCWDTTKPIGVHIRARGIHATNGTSGPRVTTSPSRRMATAPFFLAMANGTRMSRSVATAHGCVAQCERLRSRGRSVTLPSVTGRVSPRCTASRRA